MNAYGLSTLTLTACILCLGLAIPVQLCAQPRNIPPGEGVFEWFPILMYDTDIGVGAGGKVIFLNYFDARESFKLTAFASTRGERWLRLEHSWPDTELRQGTEFDIAVDVVADYDKMLQNNYFGVGNDARYDDREAYTRAPLDLQLRVSRGVSHVLVGQVSLRYLQVWSSNFDSDGSLAGDSRSASNARTLSAGLQLRYDTRDSYVHPRNGFVAQAEAEYAPDLGALFFAAGRMALWLQAYGELWDSGFILAGRAGLQSLFGSRIPVQFLLPIGGNATVRGLPQDRLLDRVSGVLNLELRIPLFWRLGALIGVDAGRVWHEPRQIGVHGWTLTPVAGLRYYLDYDVVRMDVGLGPDTFGLYFNFGHVF